MAPSPESSSSGDDESPPAPPPMPSSNPPTSPSSSSPPPKSPPNESPPPPQSSNNNSPPPPPQSSNNNSPPPPPSSVVPPPRSSSRTPSSSGTLSPPSSSSSSRSPSKESNSKSKGESSSSSVDLSSIIGVTVGIGLLLIIMIVTYVYCTKKKKKKKQHDHMHYYEDPQKGNHYYNSGPNWHKGAQMDHVLKVPPGAMPSPGHMWGAPSPPPQMMNSSDMSSNYSAMRPPPLPPPSPGYALGFNKSTFTYEELATATGGFSQANLLGQGGFGYVYKGTLPNGKEIAVKQLKSGSGQGEREFQAEVEIISRVHHRHLVSLEGYCIAGGQRMLVYDYVPNNTLEYHLHGEDGSSMDWPTRLKIALGSAKGLAYLHEDCHPKIIHRDIKTANILLDYNFDAMVADFGLAKLSSDNYTHVSTRVMGTFGYLAPEYASSGKLTEKSDVFSFGVMLLELITGRRPVDTVHSHMDDSLVDWARPILNRTLGDGNYSELVDHRLENNYNPNEMARMVACAAACVRHSAKRRPKMSQIVRALEGDVSLEDLNEGVRPGQSSVFSSDGSTEYNSSTYNADMKQFRKMALATQGFASGNGSTQSSNNSASASETSREMIPNNNQRSVSQL
ncbi:hypothetical protein AAC387_Pa09g2027 [Persea americana]